MSQATLRPSQRSHLVPPSLPSPSQLRQLVFGGTITLAVTLAGSPTSTFYVQAPRISYLPLLLAQIRTLYLPLVSDEVAVEDQLWFDYQGAPLKWHWPIGLLYDYHTAHSSLLSAAAPPSLASYFNPPTLSTSARGGGVAGEPPTLFEITLHLKDPPTDALLLNSSVDVCRTSFMNMVKEADYVRWGSVKRVTNLRKEQQDALWDSVVRNDFERYWTVASKLVPLPSSSLPDPRAPTPSGSNSSGDGRLPEAHAMRSVPMRVYLPEGAPVLQDVVPPLLEGQANTLYGVLSTLTPLFFPPLKPPLAKAVVHGVTIPLETEVGWMGACLAGADGWIAVVLVLKGR